MSVTSENIIKLRALSHKLSDEGEYKVIVKQMKTIVDEGKKNIDSHKTPKTKVACYENMCLSIMQLLQNIKI